MWRSLCLTGLLLFTASCDDGIVGTVTDNPSIPLVELLSAPTNPRLGSQRLDGEATLSRDFTTGDDVPHLRAVIRVTPEDASAPLAEPVRITRLWVVGLGSVWETSSLAASQAGPPESEVLANAEGGPEWTTGSNVDVVVRLEGETTGSILLRMPGVVIQRVGDDGVGGNR